MGGEERERRHALRKRDQEDGRKECKKEEKKNTGRVEGYRKR